MLQDTQERAATGRRKKLPVLPFLAHTLKGVTLTELLLVLAIISLLTVIAVPTYIGRVERAKIVTAHSDCKKIAEAMETCALIHSYYVPIQVLDDVPWIQGTTREGNNIRDEADETIYLIDPLVHPENQGAQDQLGDFNTNARVRDVVLGWQGPFLIPPKQYVVMDLNTHERVIEDVRDWPLDPWGEPYRFYSARGIIGGTAESTIEDGGENRLENVTFGNGQLTTDNDRFDRYAIVSWGKNRLDDEDENLDEDEWDDIIYYFGGIVTETLYSPF